ncbi:MAG: hypothetical protein M3071_05810 [Actinomycetota bacterium]|nr:hypothetical protein [Actinomycetota bacterium]
MAKSKRQRGRKRKRGAGPGGRPRRIDRPAREELELEQLLAVVKERVREAHAPDTAPERVAEILAEEFARMPAPVGFVETLVDQGSLERARAVASELRGRAPGSVLALTFDAELARTVDGDPGRSDELLERALDGSLDPDAAGPLAEHMLAADRTLDALGLAQDALAEDPGDEPAQTALAGALGRIHVRELAGEKLSRAERTAVRQFSDRERLYELREALARYVDERVELQRIVAEELRDWQEDLPEGASMLDPAYEGLFRLAVEHAWLVDEGDDDELADSEPWLEDPAQSLSPLERFVADPDTPGRLAAAAASWHETVTYGLWQLADPAPAPGVWLTDLVSGVRRYAAVPPEQIDHASRWTVLIGALVALDGTWRTTGTVIPLRPGEGDAAAELTREMTIAFVEDLGGERIASPRRRKGGDPEPHGVLVGQLEPAPPPVGDLMSTMVANLIPEIAAGVMHRRSAGIGLTNMDGHRLRLITAELKVTGAMAAAQRLADHPDFRVEEEGGLSWWGRELTDTERESMIAQLRAQLGADAALDAQQSDEQPRWLRGRLQPTGDGFAVEVNSEERLTLLLELLAELGIEARRERQSVIDPAQDLPALPAGTLLGFGDSDEAVEAWLSRWPRERVPALGGVTPRVAARSVKRRIGLEAVLRAFEYDADELRRQGRPAPDIGRLRTELGMDA